MGAWGYKTFENDSALDHVSYLVKEGHADELTDSLFLIYRLDLKDYVDYELATQAMVTAEIYAYRLDPVKRTLPAELIQWIDKIAEPAPGDVEIFLTHIALQRILSNSELQELWSENEAEYGKWDNYVQELLAYFPEVKLANPPPRTTYRRAEKKVWTAPKPAKQKLFGGLLQISQQPTKNPASFLQSFMAILQFILGAVIAIFFVAFVIVKIFAR